MNLSGLNVVVTGIIPGHSRVTAEAALREAGARVQSSVTGTTDLLIAGAKVGASKTRKAEQHGVRVVTWEQAFAPDEGGTRDLAPAETADADAPPVRQVGPMLAKNDAVPRGPGWLYEIKWDGYRCVATVRGGKVTMQSRSGVSDYATRFPEVAAELAGLPDCVVDGEIVVLDEQGRSFFSAIGNGGVGSLVVFDLLELDGEDLRGKPLEARRGGLGRLVEGCERIALSPAWDEPDALLDHVVAAGLEGIVAKRRGSTYLEGSRAGDWIKHKVRLVQEFAAVGYKPGEGARDGMAGSLLLAWYDSDAETWQYVGRVGTGQRNDFWQAAADRPTADRPAIDGPLCPTGDVVWIEPFTIQVEFQKWTPDGVLWHPSVVGARTDKAPTDVRLEA